MSILACGLLACAHTAAGPQIESGEALRVGLSEAEVATLQECIGDRAEFGVNSNGLRWVKTDEASMEIAATWLGNKSRACGQ